jgi:hypothetical protein
MVMLESGERVRLVERLGYNHDMAAHAAVAMYEGKEITIIRRGGKWRRWTAQDRARPLVESAKKVVAEW